ncbi:hypothetical protein ElyMa_002423800 [Elysia marginata]|uniref:Tc1-like transposase DDE domain-containing protein n=1 Tax=Elysia marginata TaxID=1093978 RepID=A0AAV4GHC2_9GAST|nr:hypothetical protein ElyMa_002423800 [Elysia marginata]
MSQSLVARIQRGMRRTQLLMTSSSNVTGGGRYARHFATGSVYPVLPNTATLLAASEMLFVARPGLFRRNVVVQHDNATPHSANLTQQRYGWEIVPILPTV